MTESAISSSKETYATRVIVCILLLASIGYLSIDGHQTKFNLLFPGDLFGNCFAEIDDNITWMHGWPIAYYVRNSLDTLKINSSTVDIDIKHDSTFHFSPWPFDNSPTLAFSWLGFVLNIAFLVALTAATWVALSSFNLPRIQFRIRTLLTVMAVIAFLLAFDLLISRYMYMASSFIMISFSIAICCRAGFRVLTRSMRLVRDDAVRGITKR